MALRYKLHDHQGQALSELRSSLLAGFRRPMLCAPTGSGKTILAASLIDGALSKGKRVIFTVPNLSLIDQTVERFVDQGITDVGVIQAQHPLTDLSQPVQIASVQTLMRRKIPPADLVIVDEAHKWFDFYERWMNMADWRNVPFIGLSATPGTKGLGKHYNNLIHVSSTAELIEKGLLSPFKVYAPSSPDLSKVKIVAGDYDEGELSEAMQPLVADVVETWMKLGRGRPTLCFAVDRNHAKKLQVQFESHGVRAGYVDAFTGPDERKRLMQDFRSGAVEVICNVGVLTTGVDEDVRCLILARPTRSKMLFVQIIGRALRTAKGKDYGLILDHSDTHLRLGFVTDIHFNELNDGTKPSQDTVAGEEPKPKKCQQCGFVRPPKTKTCPACGFEAKPKGSEIECEDGELIEITPKKSALPSREEQQRWLSMLMHIAQEKGKPPGWATGRYFDKWKVWPNGLDKSKTMEPTADVKGFVQHMNIKNFHRRKKEGNRAASA
jgi:superfamily II DNA or RNA helicase